MSKPIAKFNLEPEDNRRLARLCGQLDENLHLLEEHFHVHIQHRSFHFTIKGEAQAPAQVEKLLKQLYADSAKATEISPAHIELLLQSNDPHGEHAKGNPPLRVKHKMITPRNAHQQEYLERIHNFDVNFAIGPAGTGKTYLAVMGAVEALEQNKIRRIVLVRPAVEAGEHLGFLPGDLSQKVDPYLRPLYDALYEMFGFEQVIKFIERGIIEIAPLAFMRGRTLNESFIILDEAQNTTVEQMKMFLTRMGFGSKMVICGDITQTDLAKNVRSGLHHCLEIIENVPGISFTYFTANDVVRHPLVQRIVSAYEKYEAQH